MECSLLSINKLYSKYTEAYSKFINIPKVWGVRIAKNVTSCSISYDPTCLNYLITIVCVPAVWSVAVTSGGIFTQDNIISSQALHTFIFQTGESNSRPCGRTDTHSSVRATSWLYLRKYLHTFHSTIYNDCQTPTNILNSSSQVYLISLTLDTARVGGIWLKA